MTPQPPDIEPIDFVEHAPGRWGARAAAPATGRTERGPNWLAGFLAGVIVGMVIGSAMPARALPFLPPRGMLGLFEMPEPATPAAPMAGQTELW